MAHLRQSNFLAFTYGACNPTIRRFVEFGEDVVNYLGGVLATVAISIVRSAADLKSYDCEHFAYAVGIIRSFPRDAASGVEAIILLDAKDEGGCYGATGLVLNLSNSALVVSSTTISDALVITMGERY